MVKRDLGGVAVATLTRPGVGSALLAVIGVYVVLAVQSILGSLVFIVTDASYSQDIGAYLGLFLRAWAPTALGSTLPFAIGVFVSFWQLAPVVPQLRMAHVVTRALLAAVIGAVAAAIITYVFVVLAEIGHGGPAAFLGGLVDAGRAVLPGSLSLLVEGVVVVPLAALLLWGWLQSHPPKRTLRGALDEV